MDGAVSDVVYSGGVYLLFFTCFNISRDLLGGVVVSAVVYRFQYLQEFSPWGGVVVSAVVHIF